MAAYSQDLRDRVLNALSRGEGPTEIARRFEVSRLWVYKVRDRFEQAGERGPKQLGGYRRSRVEGHEQQIRDWIKAQPDLTLVEICERLQESGVQIKPTSLWYQLDKWGLSFKKNAARQRARSTRRAAS
jgi:transposase